MERIDELRSIPDVEEGVPSFTLNGGELYLTVYNRNAKIWKVKNHKGLDQRFKTLREADEWVKSQLMDDKKEKKKKRDKSAKR